MSATSPPSASPFGYSNVPMATSPPVMSFKYIQDQEARAHEALRQISNKSLEKIQVGYLFPYNLKILLRKFYFYVSSTA